MKRSEILDTAKTYVNVDRAAQHGDAERNFGLIATYWSAHLNVAINAADVAVMMTLMKLARARSNPKHTDNWIDGCGYLALGGEARPRPPGGGVFLGGGLRQRPRQANGRPCPRRAASCRLRRGL